jgi:hypothetical protein
LLEGTEFLLHLSEDTVRDISATKYALELDPRDFWSIGA